VYDSSNDHNATGYLAPYGSGDITPPAAPSGLIVL
jgi:hypothetical protein